MLSRAGIINVYQYGDETLDFGGGRLLLRGVNGSGKSTAMNMLLPFLLDADTRRIDAAGEQSGVLRAWMLSGRDEPQPQGYLWLEDERTLLLLLGDLWFRVEVEALPKERVVEKVVAGTPQWRVLAEPRYDVVLRRHISRTAHAELQQCERLYGSNEFYAVTKRQISSREIKAHQLR